MPRYQPSDFVDAGDVAAERALSPPARQLCAGSNVQVDTVVSGLLDRVRCPTCDKSMVCGAANPDRDKETGERVLRGIVPSHLPDRDGLMRAEKRRVIRERAEGRRPY